jgi:hypothetical protein
MLLCAGLRLFAGDVKLSEISDDSTLRINLAKTWFIDPPASVLQRAPFIYRLPSGERVRVRAEAGRAPSGEFSIFLERERGGRFSGWAQGTFILTRSRSSGEALRAQIFLRSDADTYVQFRPLDAFKAEMDAVVYDALLAEALPVPFSFDRILTVPVLNVLDAAGEKFPRRYYEPESGDSREKRALINNIRTSIKGLQFADDGALDEQGNYVFIANGLLQQENPGLNCSGFSKWVIDGLLQSVSGKKLGIEGLKVPYGERGSSFTRPFEQARDSYFGLDWIRNLAAAAGTAFKSSAFAVLPEIEVQNAPFASIFIRRGRATSVRHYPGHLDEAGFGFEGIQPLLYTLAVDEPHSIFLAAINTVGGTPPLRTFFHIAVLVPYFDEDDAFHVAVFESAEETSFNRFRVRYPDHYVNLCRLPVATDFNP